MVEVEYETQEKPNSVEFSINAKGQWSGKLKVYAETIEEAVEKAKTQAFDMENLILQKNKCV